MKFLPQFDLGKDSPHKFINYGGTNKFIHKIIIGEDEDDGIYLADGTKIIDKDGNFTITDISLVDLTATGDIVLGDASTDSLTVGATSQFNAPITVGVNDTGHDVKFFGATAGSYMLWDESADALIINAGTVDCGTSCEADAYTVGGTAGVDYSSTCANITVVKGIVTAVS